MFEFTTATTGIIFELTHFQEDYIFFCFHQIESFWLERILSYCTSAASCFFTMLLKATKFENTEAYIE